MTEVLDLAAFVRVEFSDPESGERILRQLLATAVPGLHENLVFALEESAEPLKSLVGIERYLERCLSPRAALELMGASPSYVRLLATIFAQSHFLTDIVCRHPEYVPWLWDEADRARASTREEMLDELGHLLADFGDFDTCFRVLRRYRRRELLRIAVRDIFDHATLASVTEDVSNLADTAIDVAYRCARAHAQARFGIPRGNGNEDETAFTIIGMGKLGGRELNFCSDIDLLFLYADEGETSGGSSGQASNGEYFQKLGERLIKILSEQSEDGLIFRVDMRLRPHGRMSPLAVSVDNAVEYYVEQGSAWERQALIKARCCGGDPRLGEVFVDRLRPFIYPGFFDDATLEDIRAVKQQAERMIAEKGQSALEVKQGRGGIRDIEFTVQMLQLLNGGRLLELRTPNTLEAIGALGRTDCLRPLDARTLASNYTFLRQVEHRLQIEGGQQRHALPPEGPALDEIARRLGYRDGGAFMNTYRDRAHDTRAILDQFLATKGAGHLWVSELLNSRSEAQGAMDRLAELGFADPVRAREEFLLLANGRIEHPYSLRVRQQFAEIAPKLIEALAAAPDPDQVLLTLGRIFAGVHAPASLYDLLRTHPDLCQYLVTLAANSRSLCAALARDPGLLDLLSAPTALRAASTRESLEAEHERLAAAFEGEAALYRLHDGETLRVAMGELIGGRTLAQVGDQLTLLAEVVLRAALNEARAAVEGRFGAAEGAFAILGLGKLGGWEMGYGSDLDLVFVFETPEEAAQTADRAEYYAAVASHALRRLKEPTRHGTLYDVDARLRPDGNKGVLAVSHRRLSEYYLTEAQAWERLALMKVRYVAGDEAFGQEIERNMKKIAFSLKLDRDVLTQVNAIRQRHIEKAAVYDLKHAPGALFDIELTTRFYQLRHAAAHPGLQRGDVFGALDILDARQFIPPASSHALRKAYAALRGILNRLRMMDGSHTTKIPEDTAERTALARRIGIDEDLAAHIHAHFQRVREVYEAAYDIAWNDAKA